MLGAFLLFKKCRWKPPVECARVDDSARVASLYVYAYNAESTFTLSKYHNFLNMTRQKRFGCPTAASSARFRQTCAPKSQCSAIEMNIEHKGCFEIIHTRSFTAVTTTKCRHRLSIPTWLSMKVHAVRSSHCNYLYCKCRHYSCTSIPALSIGSLRAS